MTLVALLFYIDAHSRAERERWAIQLFEFLQLQVLGKEKTTMFCKSASMKSAPNFEKQAH